MMSVFDAKEQRGRYVRAHSVRWVEDREDDAVAQIDMGVYDCGTCIKKEGRFRACFLVGMFPRYPSSPSTIQRSYCLSAILSR